MFSKLERKFQVISAYHTKNIRLPSRKTKHSAGYDMEAAEDILIPPGEVRLVPTGLKAQMWDDEVLFVFIRSSLAVKRLLMLANGVGVIDADYYNNPDNEGHIMVALYNAGVEPAYIEKGERIAQGIFSTFYVVTGETGPIEERLSGFGSTGQ